MTGDLVRHAFLLYSQHFPKFIRLSLIVNLPLVIISALGLLNGSLKVFMVLPPEATTIASGIFKLLGFFGSLIIGPVIYATATRLVAQLQAAPLRRIAVRPAFAALRKILRPFIVTNLLVVVITFIGLILCFFPAVWFLVTFSLWSSVVMMEGKFGRAALRRSKELVKRSWRTAALVAIIQFVLPLLVAGIFTTLIMHFGEKIKPDGVVHVNGMMIMLGQAAKIGEFSELISELVTNTVNIFTLPFGAILCALLYLKTRQAGGETLKEMLTTIADEDLPKSAWQRRMRERLQLSGGSPRNTPARR